jgi:hypothetical protein
MLSEVVSLGKQKNKELKNLLVKYKKRITLTGSIVLHAKNNIAKIRKCITGINPRIGQAKEGR